MLGNLASNKTTLLIYPSSRPPTLLSLSLGKAIALFTSSPLSSIMKRFGISKKKKKETERERDSILYIFTLRRTLDILIPANKNFSNQTSYI